jgi:hypothetical protein
MLLVVPAEKASRLLLSPASTDEVLLTSCKWLTTATVSSSLSRRLHVYDCLQDSSWWPLLHTAQVSNRSNHPTYHQRYRCVPQLSMVPPLICLLCNDLVHNSKWSASIFHVRVQQFSARTYELPSVAALWMFFYCFQGVSCGRGVDCPFAHSVYEYWLHPTRFRTQMCKKGNQCNRTLCFFAHR